MMLDLRKLLWALPEDERVRVWRSLSPAEQGVLGHDWQGVVARENQRLPPGDWTTWLIQAGRGFGKTRTGAEAVRALVAMGYGRIALVGRTAADVRDVMVEGESGLLACYPRSQRPKYYPSKRRVCFNNRQIATCYSADEPDLLRGPQHDAAWCDELAAWTYEDTWDQLQFGLRLGAHPRCIVTTTPRPKALLRRLAALPTTIVTRGSTHDNLVNLSPSFRDAILSRYEGTTLGRQEIYAELLDEMPGALWTRSIIERCRAAHAPQLSRVVVAVDPATTSTEGSDETGIVVAGLGAADRHVYVLEDVSMRGKPDAWARSAIVAYETHRADRVVYEANQGGDMVAETLRAVAPNVPLRAVHASRGKRTRAEPVSALYEQGRVHHVGGALERLEDQMVSWVPDEGSSPDRVDALVWACAELVGKRSAVVIGATGGGEGAGWL